MLEDSGDVVTTTKYAVEIDFQKQHVGSAMESSASTASSPSLKKLKREAAQRRKAQARSLKLRADEQERLQRLEIDALVEQQRLQRLERQRCEELAAARVVLQGNSAAAPGNSTIVSGGGAATAGAGSASALQQHNLNQSYDGKSRALPGVVCGGGNIGGSGGSNGGNNNNVNKSQQQLRQQQQGFNCRGGDRPNSCMPDVENHQSVGSHRSKSGVGSGSGGLKISSDGGGGGGGWRNKESQRSKHAHQQSMRAAVESRRRLARGPRSGVVVDANPTLPSEDHRVVTTEYQAAGTQALMRVTLLAAGFVIGARGISARLIGQVTGAIVQSWTESCRPDAVPIRLFRIQGKKAVVQAAVALIGQAVAKYKDLCDCKRRGEFVQREHIINNVEFYYQPPPRKAFAMAASDPQLQQQQQQHQSCLGTGGGNAVSAGPGAHGGGNGNGSKIGHVGIGNEGNDTSVGGVVGHATAGLIVGVQGPQGGVPGAGVSMAGGVSSVVGTSSPVSQISYTTHHVWLQHLHAQQQKQQQHAQLQEKQKQHHEQELQQAVSSAGIGGSGSVGMASGDGGRAGITAAGMGRQQAGGLFFDWRSQQRQHTPPSPPPQQQHAGLGLGAGGNLIQGQILQASGLSKCGVGEVQDLHRNGSMISGEDRAGTLVVDSTGTSSLEMERIDHGQGLQQPVSSLEQAFQHVRLQEQQRLLQRNRAAPEIGSLGGGANGSSGGAGGVGLISAGDKSGSGIVPGNSSLKQSQQMQQLHLGNEGLRVPSLWSEVGIVGHERATGFQLGSSLFSIFGAGKLPVPINSSNNGRASSTIVEEGTSVPTVTTAGSNPTLGLQQHQQLNTTTLLTSSASATPGDPFDFPQCDFLRESLDRFPFAPRVETMNSTTSSTSNCMNGSHSEYSLYGHSSTSKNVNVVISDSAAAESSNLCIVCLEQPAGVRLMACGHASFCLTCVQGLVNCPLCREKIVGLQQSGPPTAGARASSMSPAAAVVASSVHQRSGSTLAPAKLSNGSSYHLWNWIPGASV